MSTSPKKTYSEKLKDPRWQKMRLEILNRDEFMCKICGDTKSTLHVHHRRYITNRDPWDYPMDCLVTLCENCHEAETESLSPACSDLISMIKDKFFSGGVIDLAYGFHNLPIITNSEVTATVIKHWLSDPILMRVMEDEYFRYLSEKHKDLPE